MVKRPTDKFRAAAVQAALKSESNLNCVASEFGVSHTTLTRWLKNRDDIVEARTQRSDLLDELSALRNENNEIRAEIEVFRKATLFIVNRLKAD